ncbi:uncharacterized protein BP01DRAFT_413271 [Aspergillus saccharolyticus JOP 1030-1]|uniref:Mmc1 C-terminal domain-containing protein n=1 Tax=Aspergillus saccharolyticus JOP 1030-1 TaxID=1450539 RepID=A0A318ZPE3_9EURO|nr:hypothetical protein BP01DRAFT_413271 [Aspergillus saccharolyticus JOP 1030-1]PYH48867.1 hypothetical protein BP01DRAFT_413271 [Aspergillus saccharolyticus JOP 1030-1]
MPPKLRGSLSASLANAGRDPATVFYCPSCSTWRRNTQSALTLARHAGSTVASSTSPQQPLPLDSQSPPHPLPSTSVPRPLSHTVPVVHAGGRSIPPRLKELHAALDQLKDVATEQVNLSRLQLALRGLESETPLIRVAVLGLNDASAARRLVRLLLADPLNGKESWEDMLEEMGAETGALERGLLIRYGPVSQSIPNDLLPTISIPSPILKKGNLEILITSLGADTRANAKFTADTFLVPTVTIQTSHTGRHNMVRYPVHRSIVCGSGVDGFLAYSGLMARSDLKEEAGSVFGAIELPVTHPEKYNGRVAFVDIDKADEALAKFRESVQNASLYERGWNSSGVQPVVDWLTALRAETGRTLDPSLRTLITSLLDAAEAGVAAAEAQRIQEQEMGLVPLEVRNGLDRSVSEWAEKAHTELRSSLEEGFASKPWKGLAWWKLFWRVDDVGMITGEILDRKFLRQAEREVIWTAGRFQQAGLIQTTPPSSPTELPSWPTQIPTRRTKLVETTAPALQALAQRLVLFSMSTTTLSSALSILTYLSWPAASVYETCTMAAVGLIYSLRRQQRKWESARSWFENEAREDGRTALLETEEHFRGVVQKGGQPLREADPLSPLETRQAIDRARKALEEVD